VPHRAAIALRRNPAHSTNVSARDPDGNKIAAVSFAAY
jgi:hypothetical protein